jgi:hypothetical protein
VKRKLREEEKAGILVYGRNYLGYKEQYLKERDETAGRSK